jgi:hypothetical protein
VSSRSPGSDKLPEDSGLETGAKAAEGTGVDEITGGGGAVGTGEGGVVEDITGTEDKRGE